HLRQLRTLAHSRGLTLDASGLHAGSDTVASRSEKEIYRALGLAFIEPELREGRDEIDRASRGDLPRLVRDSDIRGILHAHTDRSDGADSLERMAEATHAHGYSYFGVADHSRSAHYAGGLSVEEIADQHVEVDRLNAKYDGRFRIF